MERAKMFMCVVVALTLLCFFSASMVQAQVLDGTTHQLKFGGSLVEYDEGSFLKDSGSETTPAVLRQIGGNAAVGFDYEIRVLTETGSGNNCLEEIIGTLYTYPGENEAFGDLNIEDFPEDGRTFTSHFFAQVKNTPNKTGFKSVAGWAEIEDGTAPDPDQITKSIKVQAKEKAADKLGLQCTIQ